MPWFTPTGWKFVTSAGGDVAVNVLGITAAGQIGVLHVRDLRQQEHRYAFANHGAGFSAGFNRDGGVLRKLLRILSTYGLDVYTTGMTSGNIGTVWKGQALGENDLTPEVFAGDCMVLTGQVAAIYSGSIALILCTPTGTTPIVDGAAVVGGTFPGGPPLLLGLVVYGTILRCCKCVGLMYGTSLGLGVGAGAFALYGGLRRLA